MNVFFESVRAGDLSCQPVPYFLIVSMISPLKQLIAYAALILTGLPNFAFAADPDSESARPIKALLVTGGCCHDYSRQKLILTRGISARANVQWTVVQQGGSTTNTPIPLYDDPGWADGFDVIVHNECFAAVKDSAFVDRILKPHQEGTPAILIHCAMHCYRTGDDRWFEFVGIESPGHGPHYSFTAKNVQTDHPIMAGFGESFVAPKGELYHSKKVFASATPLAQAKRQSDGEPQTCIWTNDYHGTRVFGTTIGHYNETMAQPQYLDMMAKAVLWAVKRDPAKDFRKTTPEQDAEILSLVNLKIDTPRDGQLPVNCCGDQNLAYQKPVTSKSVQNGNFRKHLTDGSLSTRFCPNGSQIDEWVTVDLQQAKHVKKLRLHWEKRSGIVYKYIVETSADNKSWTRVVDDSANEEKGGIRAHTIDAPNTRYIRITFLGASRGLWGSLWELEASEGELPDLGDLSKTPDGPQVKLVDVQVPGAFEASLFGVPPEVNYPVCLTATADGDVYVGVDEMGSLGKEKGRGKILRCRDIDGDGAADQVVEFAKVDHPRGLVYDRGNLWVLHPPTFSVYRDTNDDGVADESEVLIEGISTDDNARRGADHTTNGITLGVDGWIYIAVGDYGFRKAVAADGTTLSRRGGGVVRIRPDGTEMEIYAWGLRNILDVAIDPYMNMFTRGNTNDGGGWDVRLTHVLQTANYGYPSLYKNFTLECMPPLVDVGGGSGCGAMFLHDERWPDEFKSLALTCDWGRSQVYSHVMPANGATFDAQEATFARVPRPTDIDADASGRLYISSWKNGGFSFSNPNVGFVAQVIPKNFLPKPAPHAASQTDSSLVSLLNHASAKMRLEVQGELLRRGDEVVSPLKAMASEESAPLYARVAAIYSLKSKLGEAANPFLADLSKSSDSVREHCLRALADRKTQLANVPSALFVEALADSNPRVVAAAIVGLGRLGDDSVAPHLLRIANASSSLDAATGDLWRQADPSRVLPHLATKSLVALNAADACLAAIGTSEHEAAIKALRAMHTETVVGGLLQKLSTLRDETVRAQLWTTLIRLYHREGDYNAKARGWWGTRPDTTGPYYDRQTWQQSSRIAAAIKVGLSEADPRQAAHLRQQLKRHVVKLGGIDAVDIAAMKEPQVAIKIPPFDKNDPNQIGNIDTAKIAAAVKARTGDASAGKKFFKSQACIHCHTYASGQQPKGPHLVDIGKRYKASELIESIVSPSKKIAQGFDTWTFLSIDGSVETGFVVLESAEAVTIRGSDGLSKEILQDDIDIRKKQEKSMMPAGLVNNLTPQQLADLIAYLQSLR